ncbi:hypothetical protein HPP92_016066 [Vanilla planifolia]|uniref:Uncharacterized protein n=1 Tax=Vanilla planifolia TaxID=51239 RepID=A0A835QQL3_VANPL|nr:hypothetical protein HPP92_016066 [Vanilla planifolia]
MANGEILRMEEEMHLSIFDLPKGEGAKSRGQLIERKIEALESLAGKVSNRRSRRWLNQRILIELVPRLKVEEIRGLFAPPPWGEDSPPSVFCMTDIGDWDSFRNIDMDKEVKCSPFKTTDGKAVTSVGEVSRNKDVNNDKLVAMDAWRRIGYRTREAFKRSYLSELVEHYEEQVRAFICHTSDEDVLVLHVQDPFHRLLLHGVCERRTRDVSNFVAFFVNRALSLLVNMASAEGESPLPDSSTLESLLVIHNVAKRHNIGTMARSATAFGVSEIVLVGRRDFNAFGSHGSTAHLRFRHFHSLAQAHLYLKEERNCDICGVEIVDGALPVTQQPFSKSTAFLLGNEGTGLSAKECEICDFFVYIPQYGCGTASLNVTVAASIVLHHFGAWAGFVERSREGNKFLVAERSINQVKRNICLEPIESVIEERRTRREFGLSDVFKENGIDQSLENRRDTAEPTNPATRSVHAASVLFKRGGPT